MRRQRYADRLPLAHELFGTRLAHGDRRGTLLQAACPHLDGAPCNGGGNRDMARWGATEQPLAPFLDATVGETGGGFIPCGLCRTGLRLPVEGLLGATSRHAVTSRVRCQRGKVGRGRGCCGVHCCVTPNSRGRTATESSQREIRLGCVLGGIGENRIALEGVRAYSARFPVEREAVVAPPFFCGEGHRRGGRNASRVA